MAVKKSSMALCSVGFIKHSWIVLISAIDICTLVIYFIYLLEGGGDKVVAQLVRRIPCYTISDGL